MTGHHNLILYLSAIYFVHVGHPLVQGLGYFHLALETCNLQWHFNMKYGKTVKRYTIIVDRVTDNSSEQGQNPYSAYSKMEYCCLLHSMSLLSAFLFFLHISSESEKLTGVIVIVVQRTKDTGNKAEGEQRKEMMTCHHLLHSFSSHLFTKQIPWTHKNHQIQYTDRPRLAKAHTVY